MYESGLRKFDAQTWTEVAGPTHRLLPLDGHLASVSTHGIARLFWILPAHSTHLLQPLGVIFLAPLQKAYGDAVTAHIKETCTGVAQGTF